MTLRILLLLDLYLLGIVILYPLLTVFLQPDYEAGLFTGN